MSVERGRMRRHARLARWMGIIGLPLGPLMGVGILLGLLGFALNHYVWEQGAVSEDHELHHMVRRTFGWCLAAVIVPMLMMIAGGFFHVLRSS